MALLNTLANIGLTIGKAALSILSGGKSTVLEDGRFFTLHEYKVNDVVFYTEQSGGRKDVYIHNSSIKKNYMVTLPGVDEKEGDIVYLKAGESYPVTDWFMGEQPPENIIQICQVDEKSGVTNAETSKLNLSFNKLRINGSPVVMGGVKVYALNDGIQVECKNAMGLQEMQFCMLRNEKGVSMVQNDPVQPSSNRNAGETRFYPIEYSKYGLGTGDQVRGVINICVGDKALLLENCKCSFRPKENELLNKMLADKNA